MLWLIIHHLIRRTPHSTPEATMTIDIVATDTRAELEEGMAHIVGTLRRMPTHWVDRRAALHHQLNTMLDQWQKAEH